MTERMKRKLPFMRKINKGMKGVILGGACMAVLGLGTGKCIHAGEKADELKICDGIYMEDVSLGGLTEEEAMEKVDGFVEEKKDTQVNLLVGEEVVETTLGELGCEGEESDFLDEAMSYGKSGNLIACYKQMKDAKEEPVRYEMMFSVDEETISDFVQEECKEFITEPVNATLTRENGEFIVTEGVNGQTLDTNATAEAILEAVSNGEFGDEINIEAVVEEEEPEYTSESLEKCRDVIGSYTTNAGGTGGNRVMNIINAANLINGSIVYPGETFSVCDHLVPFTEENGYYPAGAYQQGKVVQELGGGVCQVSTTLYNALLEAEIEIVERSPHSMVVGYVPLSQDAAIAEGSKDLKFRNNTEVPLYIEGYVSGGYIYFNVYGEETRPADRKVEYVSETLETVAPGADVVTQDKTKPKGYEEVTQSAHTGYKACLWKVVYENGVEVSREKENYSIYNSSPRYVIKGTGAPEKPEESEKPEATKEPEKTEKPEATRKPEKPEKTEKPENTPKPTPEPTPEPAPVPTEEPEPTEAPVETEEPVEPDVEAVG